MWLVLAWFTGSWLHLQGSSLWILRIALAFIGVAAFIIVIWWFVVKDKERAADGSRGGAAGDEIDSLIREAETRLQASQLGSSATGRQLALYLIVGETGSAKTSVVLHSGLEAGIAGGSDRSGQSPGPHAHGEHLVRPAIHLCRSRRLDAAGPSKVGQIGEEIGAPPASLGVWKGHALPPRRLGLRGLRKLHEARRCRGHGRQHRRGSRHAFARFRNCWASACRSMCFSRAPTACNSSRITFAILANDEATLVFGATLPMVTYSTGVYAEQETARISGAFDNLFQSLADRRVNLLAQEFDATKLPTIYEFPARIQKTADFVGAIAGGRVPAQPIAHGPISARVLLHRRPARYDHDGGTRARSRGTDRSSLASRRTTWAPPESSISGRREPWPPNRPRLRRSAKPAESRNGFFCPTSLVTCFSRIPPPSPPAPPAPKPASGDESCWPPRWCFS